MFEEEKNNNLDQQEAAPEEAEATPVRIRSLTKKNAQIMTYNPDDGLVYYQDRNSDVPIKFGGAVFEHFALIPNSPTMQF